MSNNAEVVALVVGGTKYTAWKSISVKATFGSPEISFQLVAADEAPDLLSNAFLFEPTTPVQVLASGSLLCDGFINDLDIAFDEHTHELRVSGRSKGQDAVDCSVKHKTHEWRNKSVDQIANDTGNNARFVATEKLPPIDVVRANVGEKVAPFIDRHARAHGVYLTGRPEGHVEIGKGGKQRHAGAIVEGVNLKRAHVKFSDRDRHEKIKAKSQRAKGTGKKSTQIAEEATDSGARKGRYLAMMPDHHMDKGRAKTRAEQARDKRIGESTKFTATVVGFRDDGGQIWTPGWLVFCQTTLGHLSQDLAIQSVEFSQNDHMGSISHIELCDPRALGGKGGGKSKSAKVWTKGLGNRPAGGGK